MVGYSQVKRDGPGTMLWVLTLAFLTSRTRRVVQLLFAAVLFYADLISDSLVFIDLRESDDTTDIAWAQLGLLLVNPLFSAFMVRPRARPTVFFFPRRLAG